ncbi:MAG: BrnT family toxin [Xanthomonadales bacterium]|nr:BrnT family toxin [Xanthomonadales bacterium]
MGKLNFEWDETKSISNQRKHGVSFEEAATVFTDELARLIPDPAHSEDEERFILMGVSAELRLLTVCHCERATNIIRIISARKVDKFERKQYQEFNHA